MKFEKRFKKDLAKIETPDIEKIIPGAASKHTESQAPRARKRLSAAAVAVILCCCMVLGAAAATTVPLIRKIINDRRITENTLQLTVVPEGYVGIYTKEELLALNRTRDRNDRFYILMNDITFTDEDYAPGGILEGGFKPLNPTRVSGVKDGQTSIAYLEMFNGNGHVIRNLKFADNGAGNYGLFGGGVLSIINLGIEGCEINVKATCDSNPAVNSDLYVGAIAARAEFIGACYVDGLTINVELDLTDNTPRNNRQYDLAIGGIGGNVLYVDSCYANNATVRVSGKGLEKNASAELDSVTLSVGGIVGFKHSCVTSWFSGQVSNTVTGEFAFKGTGEITETEIADQFPVLMDGEQFEQLRAKVEAKYGEDGFYNKLFNAYYLEKNLDQWTHSERATEELTVLLERLNAMTGGKMDLENQREWHLFDPTASYVEKVRVYEVLIGAYDGDKEALAQLCEYAYIQSGVVDCYVLDLSRALNSEDLPGFDFEKVWTFRDGKPIQQVFAH